MKKAIKIILAVVAGVIAVGYIILGPLSFSMTVARIEIYNESFPLSFKKELDEINSQFERYSKSASIHMVVPPGGAQHNRCAHGNPIYDKDYCSADGTCRLIYTDDAKTKLEQSNHFVFSGLFKTRHPKQGCPYYIGLISFSRDINFAAFRYARDISSLAKKYNLDTETELSAPW